MHDNVTGHVVFHAINLNYATVNRRHRSRDIVHARCGLPVPLLLVFERFIFVMVG